MVGGEDLRHQRHPRLSGHVRVGQLDQGLQGLATDVGLTRALDDPGEVGEVGHEGPEQQHQPPLLPLAHLALRLLVCPEEVDEVVGPAPLQEEGGHREHPLQAQLVRAESLKLASTASNFFLQISHF